MLYVGAHVCITTCATIMCTTCEVSQRKQGYQVLLSLSQRVAENLAKQASQRGEREDPSLSLLTCSDICTSALALDTSRIMTSECSDRCVAETFVCQSFTCAAAECAVIRTSYTRGGWPRGSN